MGKIKVNNKGLPSISLALGDRSVSQINGLDTLQRKCWKRYRKAESS